MRLRVNQGQGLQAITGPALAALGETLMAVERAADRMAHAERLATRWAPLPLPGEMVPTVRDCLDAILRWVAELEQAALQPIPDAGLGVPGVDQSFEAVEVWHLERVLGSCQGNVEAAARRLGVTRATCYNKMTHYGLAIDRFRSRRRELTGRDSRPSPDDGSP